MVAMNMNKSDAWSAFDIPTATPTQSPYASTQALQTAPYGRSVGPRSAPAPTPRERNPTQEGDSEKQGSSKVPVGGGVISLRAVILLLVFANVAVLAVITVTIASITNNNSITSALNQSSTSIADLAKARQVDSSAQIANAIKEFLTEASSFLFAVSNGFSNGVVSLQNLDTFVPYLKATFDTVGVKDKIKACSITSFTPNLPIGLGFVHENGRADYVWQSGGTNLSSCPKTCPTPTSSGLDVYMWNDASRTFGAGLYNVSIPVPTTVTAPPTSAMPYRKVLLDPPSVAIGQILQVLSMGLYDPSGTLVGGVYERFTVQDLCGVLDVVKNSSTANSLFYVLTPQAEVLAMSGLGSWDAQQQTLTRLVDAGAGSYVLRTIWEFGADKYPMFNMTAAAIYKYAGGQLNSTFADKQFYAQKYLFQVTTLTFEGFKYVIVSGAPDTDYLGDTIALSDNLMATGRTAQAIMIASAVAVAFIMGFTSVAFTYIFVDRPLSTILDAMRKATKFDFSSIRDGTMKRASIVREINNTQGNFVAMLEVFANALKQNKNLIAGRGTTGSKSVSDVHEKSLESFTLNGPRSPTSANGPSYSTSQLL